MATQPALSHPSDRAAAQRPRYRPGDLVTTAQGYPVLYEVLAAEAAGLLRVRGLNWAPGYSATVSVETVRPVTGILSQKT